MNFELAGCENTAGWLDLLIIPKKEGTEYAEETKYINHSLILLTLS